MHRDCKALRYKVHKPGCDCPKLLRMVARHMHEHEHEHEHEPIDLAGVAAKDGTMDALVVVPDTKQRYIERFTDGIELGHHLQSVLALTTTTTNNSNNNKRSTSSNDDDDDDDCWWFVIGYDDHKSIMLDLPGGKRHLGETSLEGAIRETEEESSLTWDASWVVDVLSSRKASYDGGNRYFLLHPPQSFLDTLTD
eukprot:jgi/Psemu1/285832/fgenesh1_pg.103_\